MQQLVIGKMNEFIVHFVGNKNDEDGVRLSKVNTDFEYIEDYVIELINKSFKSEELYNFYFQPNLELNPMYNFVSSIFDKKENFIEQSQHIAKFLYDKSTHPQIKSGELCIGYFENCRINTEIVDCIGIFKSENKDTILKVNSIDDGFDLMDITGINTNKLDKGCLIFNSKKEDGFLISVVDNTNRNTEAQYWKDEFLGIKIVNNEFHQTNEFLVMAKQFLTKQISEDIELTKADQIGLLNKSVDYFKKHESFDKNEFEDEVFADKNVIDSFRKFDQNYCRENDISPIENFDISVQAVKKQARVFKSVLKLDKNFHIYIHGDRELIEQGIDSEGRKFYKIYYKEEN